LGPLLALVALSLSLPWALALGEKLPALPIPRPADHAAPAPPARPDDADADGIPDAIEDELLRRYSPTVLLSADDPSLPADIAWVRRRTGLDVEGPRLLGVIWARSGFDHDTRRGRADPKGWTMYGHAYPRADGGMNLQFWLYHPFNATPVFLFDHESDWEHVTVELDAAGTPRTLALARHADNAPGVRVPWAQVPREDDHPFVLSARGTHASYLHASEAPFWENVTDCPRDDSGVPRLEGCPVRVWRGGGPGRDSPVVNVGERSAPRMDTDSSAFFMRYGGLWGEASALPRAAPPPGPPYQRGFCVEARAGTCR